MKFEWRKIQNGFLWSLSGGKYIKLVFQWSLVEENTKRVLMEFEGRKIQNLFFNGV